ncbi:hypothetical protein KIN20_027168 [Parelaphostrongylus tenuis]|uniref:Uncharacterized protein n=1 Tax=Parelaphostrongylus tenuis TaxID=148309 RepID=A0AAD5QZC9_PARTN|nr:hypothetical protein KIN20_027168 [Parelaphostrongylus tenuis]
MRVPSTNLRFQLQHFRKLLPKATQMIHDLREQVISQRFEDLRQKWSKWRGRHPAAANLNSQFDRRASSNALVISPGPPHLKS